MNVLIRLRWNPYYESMALDKDSGRLLERAAELVSIPSVSGDEAAIADYVYNCLNSWIESTADSAGQIELIRLDNNVILRTLRDADEGNIGARDTELGGTEVEGTGGATTENTGAGHPETENTGAGHPETGNTGTEHLSERIIFASHLDTVPPVADWQMKTDDTTLEGLGAVDTKGSVAVMLELALSSLAIPVDTTFIFYSCEEIARDMNGLRHILASNPELLKGDVAIVGEPTAGIVEAGCQTTMTARIDVPGKRAHTARPWMGKNAIHLAAQIIDRVAGYGENIVEIDGCTFKEQLQAVMMSGGVAANVVPDSATITINHRAAPNRSRQYIEEWLNGYLLVDKEGAKDIQATIEVLDYAQGAMPLLENKWIGRLAGLTSTPPQAKLGWTDVATFSEVGTPACNFGPGDPELAHTPHERVTASELQQVYSTLISLICH